MDFDLADIELIRETAAWCYKRCVDPPFAGTEQLTPACLQGISSAERLCQFVSSSPVDAVKEVAELRRQGIKQLEKPLLAGPEYDVLPDFGFCLFCGRLFAIRLSSLPRKLRCLDASRLSYGFFDASGLPVWDSWSFVREDERWGLTLYGWVPNEITQYAGIGMTWFSNGFAEWLQP